MISVHIINHSLLRLPTWHVLRDNKVHCLAGPEWKRTFSLVLTFDGSTSIESSCHSQCHMSCNAKHRPILKCGKNIASILMKTQATSSTSKLRVLPLEPAINTGCQLRSSGCHDKNGGV